MSLITNQVIPIGTEIVRYSGKANGFFKGKEIERIQVLGKERGGCVPLRVKKADHEQAEYHVARQDVLQRLMAPEQAQVNTNAQLATPDDINVNKLWDNDRLWETTNGKPHLRGGTKLWATLDQNAIITDLCADKPQGPAQELVASDECDLDIVPSGHVPPHLYYQKEVFDWMLLELMHQTGQPLIKEKVEDSP